MNEKGKWPEGIKPKVNIVWSRAKAFGTKWFAVWEWLLDVSLATAIIILGTYLGFPSKGNACEVLGIALQFAGTIGVLIDLDSTIVEFGGHPLRSVFASFFTELRGIVQRPQIISATMSVNLGSATMVGHMAAMHVESNGTIEDRLKNLETRMKRQETDISNTNEAIERTKRELNERIDKEAKDREAEGARAFERIKGAITGGMHVKVGGIAYIFLGTILTTVSALLN